MRLRMREVADVVAGLVAVVGSGALGGDIGKNPLPVLDERRSMAVDFQPCQRVGKHTPIDQRLLYPRMGAKIVQPALQHHRLAQAFDIAAREGQLSELQCGGLSRLPFSWLTLGPFAAERKPERDD